jgi:hypothetical protein
VITNITDVAYSHPYSAIRHREDSHRQSRCGAGPQAHRLDERHQDLICDIGEQLIGSR